jgi:hypothetical protein
LVLQINQYFDSQQQFKDAFVKNYISLVWFDVIQDQNINLDCWNQKGAMFQFAYSDNPVENSLLYVTQLYLLDTDQKQSYMLSHVTQQKKDAKALINQMKGIACSQTS